MSYLDNRESQDLDAAMHKIMAVFAGKQAKIADKDVANLSVMTESTGVAIVDGQRKIQLGLKFVFTPISEGVQTYGPETQAEAIKNAEALVAELKGSAPTELVAEVTDKEGQPSAFGITEVKDFAVRSNGYTVEVSGIGLLADASTLQGDTAAFSILTPAAA